MAEQQRNWAGNITFGARQVHWPRSVDELQLIVANSDRMRPLGTGHSFNHIADTPGDLVSVADLPPVVDIDPAGDTVTVSGGLRYGEFVGRLHEAGYALPNLGSLPHISVAGAVATATHGSGRGNGNLATAVRAVELIDADGERRRITRGEPDFDGAVVGLGGLGVVTALTLDLRPTFQVAQHVYRDLPVAGFTGHAQEILAAGYSVSVFTDWSGGPINQVWRKRIVDGELAAPEEWFGARLATEQRNPVPAMPGTNATEQLGVPGPWFQRLPHFRLEFTPSAGDELQTEYFLAREHVVEAYTALAAIREQLAAVVQVCEFRTIAPDEYWLSPAYRRDSVAFHFTWIPDIDAVTPVLSAIEAQLAPFDTRPHWGKLFNLGPDVLRARYPRYADFADLLGRWDPRGKFRNDYLNRFFPSPG
ncbi:MAG TPA: FAD-binding protein [Pseudonocardiaceae bacterium]|jgi:xylitol oxidase|nr:FAD-binding protein [Pseudonocardiaceae bacterium]